jgi:hypothetical protein
MLAVIAADHGGYSLKSELFKSLVDAGHEVVTSMPLISAQKMATRTSISLWPKQCPKGMWTAGWHCAEVRLVQTWQPCSLPYTACS